ncbi:LuxR C-terminal-related transcriptional regulator [Cellulomonas sp. HZM]|uniref:LuxR C-terminal-related transcriptional regulator n=1 Tax=Cellulomonas sp. HZM TaxID=1454010 RepID=UPI000493808A|nr:LuxR C-terminal-related transcriptional regulator [Cellulomonas sp. HZM]
MAIERTGGATFARSKSAVPVASTWVTRADLLARLGQDPAAPLTVVLGPAGAGKTSLLGQWAATRDPCDVAWLTCDRGDVDARFWRAALRAVAAVRPGFGATCLDLLALDERVDHQLLECLLAEAEALDDPVALVLDDLHLVGPAVHDHLRFLLSRGMAQIRLLVGARSEPWLGLDRLRVTGGLVEVREADLRFDARAVRDVLRRLGAPADAHVVDLVQGRTEGWAAGVQLAGLALRDTRRRDDVIARLASSDAAARDYLWSEVLDAQPEHVREFLFDTCVAEVLTPALAAVLAPGSAVTLEDVERASLMLVRLDPAGTEFRYHQLFAELLRSRLSALDPEREAALHERAARWHDEHGRPAAAFRHRWRAGRRRDAIAGVQDGVLEAYADAALPVFDDAERVLTDDDLRASLQAAVGYASALLVQGFPQDADRLAARVAALAGESGPSGVLEASTRQQLWCVRALSALALGDTRATVRHGRTAIESGPGDDEWSALASAGVARALAWQGEEEAADETLRTAREPFGRAAQAEIAGTTAHVLLAQGHLERALGVADALAERMRAAAPASHDLRLHPEVVAASVHLERGRSSYAAGILAAAGEHVSALRLPARVLALLGLSRALWVQGDDDAFRVVDECRRLLRHAPTTSGLVDRVRARRARLLLDTGDLDGAASTMDAMSSPWLRRIVEAHLRLADGDLGRARATLENVERDARSPRRRLDASLVALALAQAEDGDIVDAARQVLARAEPEGWVLPLQEAGLASLDAVRGVARSRTVTPFVAALLAARPVTGARDLRVPRLTGPELSERERTVLGYLATSLTYPEIAATLFVSVNTIKTHAKNIMRKLGAASRADAVVRAREARYL